MHLGLTMFPTDLAISPVELGKAAEERGFESLFFPEHTHIPVSRRTPYPGGEPLPDEYKRAHDPFVALAAVAASTSTLRVGTGICLVAQRDPIVTAKEVASLDVLSGGRFVFGVGFGWNADELEDHGVSQSERRAVVRERVLAMKALWTDAVAGYEGVHVKIPPSWSWPKPIQRPHPPILVGGAEGPTLFRHIAEYADGWMPIGGAGLRGSWERLAEATEAAGRDPGSLRISITGSRPDAGVLNHYAELGVERVILSLPPEPADRVLPVLDRYAELMRAVRD